MILHESLQVRYLEISNDTKSLLQSFQEMLKITLDVYHKQSSDKRGSIESLKDFKHLRKNIQKFHNYGYIRPLIDQIGQIEKELIEKISNTRTLRKHYITDIDDALRVWKTHNIDGQISSAKRFSLIVDKFKAAKSTPLKNRRNPYFIENSLLFQTNDFLKTFELPQIQYIIDLDIDVFKYSYLALNELTQNDFQYIAYFILQLSDVPTEKEISGMDLRRAFIMEYSGPQFDTLLKMVDDYLYDNKKENIQTILQLIEQFPKIYEANENAKKNITVLYRGLPLDNNGNYNIDDVIATSKNKAVATRFAYGIGHLEPLSNRRSDNGVIETYSVTPDSIMFVVTIFGGIYGEDEVIIDRNKARLVNRVIV